MSRIKNIFENSKIENKKVVIPFITAGDPETNTVDIMHSLVSGGADIIELGIPFSDPVADGPVIEKASERAIKKGITYRDVFGMVSSFREKDKETAVILMGYLNTAESSPGGFSKFCSTAKESGVDGFIWVDLSFESGEKQRNVMNKEGLCSIPLVAPTTSDERLAKILNGVDSFVYYISVKGVTGTTNQSGADRVIDKSEISTAISRIKKTNDIPVVVGFGIKDAETAKEISNLSDGIVIGSALVSHLYDIYKKDSKLILESATTFIKDIKSAID